jgi:oligopeptide transport system permease protein
VSLWQDAWKRLRKNKVAVLGGVVLAMIILLSLIGPWLVFEYNGFSFETQDLGSRLANPSRTHLFGTDTLGRDLLARVLYGTRISLMVGLVSTLISLLIGVAYGSVAGFFGGRLDEIMMRIVDVLFSLPDLP